MALYNLSKYNPGTWVHINPISNDDGFGNLIVNSPDGIHNAIKFICDKNTH